MSTRCMIHFHDEVFEHSRSEAVASVYRCYDGYPDGESGIAATLAKFFQAVSEQTGLVGHHANLLAAQYIVWQSTGYQREPSTPLDFYSVYIMREEPEDIEYRYRVYCDFNLYETSEQRAARRPVVTVEHRSPYTGQWSEPEELPLSEPVKA